ncbi:MAG: DUF1990 family protein [bacterium]
MAPRRRCACVHAAFASVALRLTGRGQVHYGFWSLNGCRSVYVVNGDNIDVDGARRVAFAYGTLPKHGEIGEERFSVEWYPTDDRVWFGMYAFSRPGNILAPWLPVRASAAAAIRVFRHACDARDGGRRRDSRRRRITSRCGGRRHPLERLFRSIAARRLRPRQPFDIPPPWPPVSFLSMLCRLKSASISSANAGTVAIPLSRRP